MTSNFELNGSIKLLSIIKEHIKENGNISFSQFMELALYQRNYGYYMNKENIIGETGDFTTAPEISPLFAKCLATQIIKLFKLLDKKNIIEIGAGTGILALEILKELKKKDSLPDKYYIIEISPKLRLKQKEKLNEIKKNIPTEIIWINEIPENTSSNVLIANEVLDAIPTNLITINNDIENKKYYSSEWFVTLDEEENLRWDLCETSNVELISEVNNIQNLLNKSITTKYTTEINTNYKSFLKKITNRLNNSYLIFIDYGYTESEYYHFQRTMGTLQCFYKHKLDNNPLANPGEKDITSHVNFSYFAEQADKLKLSLCYFNKQSTFLLENDLDKHLQESSNNSLDHNLLKQVQILTMPYEMGDLCKVMILGKNVCNNEIISTINDQRHQL